MKPQSRTLVLGSSCESIEILNESDLPWEPSNDDPTIGGRKYIRPWVVPQFGNVIMRRTFPTVFNFGSHCYIWMSSTSTKKMHLDSKLFPRPRKQKWNQTLSSPGTKPRLGLNFLWFTGVAMEISLNFHQIPPKNDALINGEIRNHLLEQSILSRLSHFNRFSCQRGRIAQRSPRTRRAPQWQDSSLRHSGMSIYHLPISGSFDALTSSFWPIPMVSGEVIYLFHSISVRIWTGRWWICFHLESHLSHLKLVGILPEISFLTPRRASSDDALYSPHVKK